MWRIAGNRFTAKQKPSLCFYIYSASFGKRLIYIISIFVRFLFIKHKNIYFSYILCLYKYFTSSLLHIISKFWGVFYIQVYLGINLCNYVYRLTSECSYTGKSIYQLFFLIKYIFPNPVISQISAI